MRLVHNAATIQTPEIVPVRDRSEIRTHATFLAAERYVDPERDEDLDDEDEDEATTSAAGVLAQLSDRLRREGLEVDEVIHEDPGARIEVESHGEVFRVSAQRRRGNEWHVAVGSPDGAGVVLPDTAELCTLLVCIDGALRKVTGVKRLAWHTREAWDAGNDAAGKPRPITDPAPPPRTGKFRKS
ncbi:MAG: hypothetical protein WKG00_21520 [Polyangiaceae bacterium]